MLIKFFLVFKDCRLIMQIMPNYTKNQRNAHRMKSFIKSKQHLDTNTQTHMWVLQRGELSYLSRDLQAEHWREKEKWMKGSRVASMTSCTLRWSRQTRCFRNKTKFHNMIYCRDIVTVYIKTYCIYWSHCCVDMKDFCAKTKQQHTDSNRRVALCFVLLLYFVPAGPP